MVPHCDELTNRCKSEKKGGVRKQKMEQNAPPQKKQNEGEEKKEKENETILQRSCDDGP